ncbi:MAG: cyclopropane-fatty-acyl-phospholipid synthase family protein [Gammaproteobacteria bacterium]|nr:cyclopropane-fatty-acyl-phospholipid synthase family protein [Gammaproteobacteria bacterium]NNF62137.1 class I SAM-dependent methyltransferase [Gammaproteobacteria bacterium]
MNSVAIKRSTARESWLDRLGRRLVLAQLSRLRDGQLIIKDPAGEHTFGQPTERCPLSASIEVVDTSMYAEFAFGGNVAAGESYMRGMWRADDLAKVTQIFSANLAVLQDVERGVGARLKSFARRRLHGLNKNSRSGSQRNIRAHYDLGNEFFRLFLDESMMYSSAVFPEADASLEDASFHKNELLCKKLALRPDDHLLEIGTGWGGFAIHAARRFGCRVTTTTISAEQHAEAQKRVQQAGLTDRVELLTTDYRDLEGQYDKLVSIEMIEAVGHHYLDTYFQKCASLLKPDGLMALQAITVPAQRYEYARDNVDFIKRYIFPGGFLPSVEAIAGAVKRRTDMEFAHLEEIGMHYGETLRHWRDRFASQLAEVRRQGYPETFIRMWEYYLCYCEGGFRERVIGATQLVLAKPGYRS